MNERFSGGRLDRLEDKLEKIAGSLDLLARLDERLVLYVEDKKRMSERLEKIERRLDKLEISRAKFLGAIAVVSFVASALGPSITRFIFG